MRINKLTVLLPLLVCCVFVSGCSADVIFTDFVSGQSGYSIFSYGFGNVPIPPEPGYTVANFSPVSKSFILDDLTVAVNLSASGPLPQYMYAYLLSSTSSGAPGAIIDTFQPYEVNTTALEEVVVTLDSSSHPLLLAKQQYWIALTAEVVTYPEGLSGGWFDNSVGAMGMVEQGSPLSNLTLVNSLLPAFEVDGTPTAPEPSIRNLLLCAVAPFTLRWLRSRMRRGA